MSRPTLSLLIPAYNAARFLPRLLASAHAQTEPFDEVWVYDDCSTDDTATVAAAHGAKVVRGEVNVGCSVGKNRLARLVETDWVHFHDADDELLPNFVESAHSWTAQKEFEIIACSFDYVEFETGKLIARSAYNKSELVRDPVRYNILNKIPNFALYRRSAFLQTGGFDEDDLIRYNEDVASHLRMAVRGLRFTCDERRTCINYRFDGSMSAANGLRCAIANYHVMRRALEMEACQFYKKEIGANLWAVAGVIASFGDWVHAKKAVELAASLSEAPETSGKVWFRLLAAASPYAAIRTREAAIRLLKPSLRRART